MAELLDKLETETCTRCGGSGHYSYCQSYGTTCFRCRGRKVTYSKRGAAAALYLESLRKKPANQFQPGDLLYVEGIPGFTKSKFYKVLSVWMKIADRCEVVIECDGYGYHSDPDTMLRKGCTAEEKAETLKQALAYQATLTKMGKVAKKFATTPPLFS